MFFKYLSRILISNKFFSSDVYLCYSNPYKWTGGGGRPAPPPSSIPKACNFSFATFLILPFSLLIEKRTFQLARKVNDLMFFLALTLNKVGLLFLQMNKTRFWYRIVFRHITITLFMRSINIEYDSQGFQVLVGAPYEFSINAFKMHLERTFKLHWFCI